jgi:hypothetical protein
MSVTKSNYVATLNGESMKLDCAPFPRSEGKKVPDLTVNGVAVPSAVSRSKTEVYYTYFMWEGKSYSFQRGVLVEAADGEITLTPVAGKPAPAPKVEEVVVEAPAMDETNEVLKHILGAIEAPAPKAKRSRKPKGE